MTRPLIAVLVCGLSTCCLGGEAMDKLPTPRYQKRDTDPGWLARAAQFHGHLGPWATAGTRAGMAGLRAVRAEGYFDVEVTCQGPFVKPPRSCFLDGLQVATGATVGKRNLQYVEAQMVAVRIKNLRTGQQVEVRPTAALLELLSSFPPRPKAQTAGKDHDDDQAGNSQEDALEAVARKISTLPEKEILHVDPVDP